MTAADETGALDLRLENWGAAISGRSFGGARGTESIEGRYRSPQQWHALGAPQALIEPDHEDAQIIESAVVLLPLFYHALLRAWYVRRLSPGTCVSRAREVGGAASPEGAHFPRHLDRAQELLVAALALPAVIRRDRARAYVRKALDLGDAAPMAALDRG
ncbi:MAG: hypothetical protein IT519_08025 [Burkholderiales bacterium]|nr:hypothetical protein [Burkholderiales bacterium]